MAGSAAVSCCSCRGNRHQGRTTRGNPLNDKTGIQTVKLLLLIEVSLYEGNFLLTSWQSKDLRRVSLCFCTQLYLCSREDLNLGRPRQEGICSPGVIWIGDVLQSNKIWIWTEQLNALIQGSHHTRWPRKQEDQSERLVESPFSNQSMIHSRFFLLVFNLI